MSKIENSLPKPNKSAAITPEVAEISENVDTEVKQEAAEEIATPEVKITAAERLEAEVIEKKKDTKVVIGAAKKEKQVTYKQIIRDISGKPIDEELKNYDLNDIVEFLATYKRMGFKFKYDEDSQILSWIHGRTGAHRCANLGCSLEAAKKIIRQACRDNGILPAYDVDNLELMYAVARKGVTRQNEDAVLNAIYGAGGDVAGFNKADGKDV